MSIAASLLLVLAAQANAQWVLLSPNTQGGWQSPTEWGRFDPAEMAWEKLTGHYWNGWKAGILVEARMSPEFVWNDLTCLPPTRVYFRENTNLRLSGMFDPLLIAGLPFETGRSESHILGYGDLRLWGQRYSVYEPTGISLQLSPVTLFGYGEDSVGSPLFRVSSNGSYAVEPLPHHWIRVPEPDVEPNYRKAPTGEPTPTNPLLILNKGDRDKKVVLDVAAPYSYDGTWRGAVMIDGRYSYWSNPSYSVVHYGSATPNAQTNSSLIQNIPLFVLGTISTAAPESQTLGTTSELEISVSDGSDLSSPILTNSISIRWHKTHENWRKHLDDQTGWEELPCDKTFPGYAIFGGSVMCSWTAGGAWHWGSNEYGGAFGAGVLITSLFWPELAPLFSLIGLTLSNIEFQPMQNAAVFNWGAPNATYHPDRNDSRISDYRMYPVLEGKYKMAYAKADRYGSTGFLGPDYIAVKSKRNVARFVQRFVRDDINESGSSGLGEGS